MYTKEDIEKAKQYLDNEGYGTGSNFTLNMVANLMAEYAAKNCVIPALISWVAASEKLPSVEQNGNKVLIYRIMNDSQSSLAISIHETNMVKYCNPNETWWMELPKPPCL